MIFKNLLRNCVFLNSKQILNVSVRMLPRKLLTFCLALPLHNTVHNYEYFFLCISMFWERKKTKLNFCLENSITSLSLDVSFLFCFRWNDSSDGWMGWFECNTEDKNIEWCISFFVCENYLCVSKWILSPLTWVLR